MSAEAEVDRLPHFRRRASDPVLAPGVLGVLIHTAGVDSMAGGPRWPLRGCFRVPRVDGGGEPQAVLQRIVISLTDLSSHGIQARHAFRDELSFAEDVRDEGALVAGDFHVDLLRLFEFEVATETYFVTASIGQAVSTVIRCTCEMPWAAPRP